MPTVKCITPIIGSGSKDDPYTSLLSREFRGIGWVDVTRTEVPRFVRLRFMIVSITGTVAQLQAVNADNRFLLPRGKTRTQVKTWLRNHLSQAVADNLVDGRDEDGIEEAVKTYCRNV